MNLKKGITMPSSIFIGMLFVVVGGSGCATKKEVPKRLGKEDIPILPSPIADTYVVGESNPKDWLVAQESVELPWDEALSGAAAKIGLDFADAPTLAAARWAATQAGYPYAVEKIIVGTVSSSKRPDGLRATIEGLLPSRGHLGMARVRRGSDDMWVTLIGKGGTRLPPIKRFYGLNEELKVEFRGLDWLLLSPSGKVFSGGQQIDIPLSERGEWWLEINNRETRVSAIPFYVDSMDPPTNLFSEFLPQHATPEESERLVHSMINNLRAAEGLDGVRMDGALRTLGLQALEDESKRDPKLGISRMVALGYPEEFSYQGVCVDDAVGTCLDALTWDMNARRILLDPDVNLLGVNSEIRTDRITLVVTLSHM
jgi:hypothetical protein